MTTEAMYGRRRLCSSNNNLYHQISPFMKQHGEQLFSLDLMDHIFAMSTNSLMRRQLINQVGNRYYDYDIQEDDHSFTIFLDVPLGLHPQDISVGIQDDGNTLNVHYKSSRKNSFYSKNMNYFYYYTESSSFKTPHQKKFHLDNSVINVEKLSVSLDDDNGVLIITLPKKEQHNKEEKIKKIPVSVIQKEKKGISPNSLKTHESTHKGEKNILDTKEQETKNDDNDDESKLMNEKVMKDDDDLEISDEEDIV